MKIITIFDEESAKVLSNKAEEIEITADGLLEAQDIAVKLLETLKGLGHAAGLAAPQIGISKKVFVYSWNRSFDNMEVAINPAITFKENDDTTSYEACFSAMQEDGVCKAALVTRANFIEVEYFNLKGEKVRKQLKGFAAKVFQHEFDHLEGIENVRKEGAKVKEFNKKEELMEFMKSVRKDDSAVYIEPTTLEVILPLRQVS